MIIWLTLFLLVLIGFGSLSVAVAKLAATRTQLQNAADAAALAGASALDPETGAIVQPTAVGRAQNTSVSHKAFVANPEPVTLAAGDVTFPDTKRVRVKVRREGAQGVVTTLAQVLGIMKLEVTATATAKVDTTSTALCGLLPLGVSPQAGQTFKVGCQFTYTLKSASGTGGGGRYGAVNFPQCLDRGDCAGMSPTGANTFRCLMKYGYCCPVSIGDVLKTESGNMAGPTKQAIDYRFDTDACSDEGICYTDYLSRGGTGQRVVVIPITTPVPGNQTVTVLGFSAFFLKTRVGTGQGGTLQGEFLYKVIPGTGKGTGGGAGVTAFSIRLVPNS
jgi:putative Flp pilus-assembly TadE/G-like protein